jgi:sugar lactone lactonase YvrE
MSRPRWDTRVLANVPPPGFPAYVHAHPNGRVYAANYTDLTGDAMPARVFEWTATGTLLRSWTPPGQDLSVPRGIQVATSDARGRLVLLDKSRARVMTLDTRTGRFRTHATVPSVGGRTAIPNYATWGPDGALYVSDYGQPVIWRVPPGGGKPEQWFRSPRLSGLEFGTTGLVYRPERRAFLVAQMTTDALTDLKRGHLYRLDVASDGSPGRLVSIWRSRTMELPDGFGVAASGAIYVALLGANQLVRLSPDGAELERFPSLPLTGDNGSAVPFDGPSNATFLGSRVLVANQSPVTRSAAHHAVLDVETGEQGATPHLPSNALLG